MRVDAASLYSDQDGPPAQGDSSLGAVARLIGDDGFCSPRWQLLDQLTAELAGSRDPVPALRVAGGRGSRNSTSGCDDPEELANVHTSSATSVTSARKLSWAPWAGSSTVDSA